MAGARPRLRWQDFLVRWLFTFGLLLATYNPTGVSYIDWLTAPDSEIFPVKVFVGVCLLILNLFVYGIALRTLSYDGVIASILFFSLMTWAGYSLGVRLPTTAMLIMWVQFAIATTMTFGLWLAQLRQHVSGLVTPSEEGGHV